MRLSQKASGSVNNSALFNLCQLLVLVGAAYQIILYHVMVLTLALNGGLGGLITITISPT